MPGFNPANYTEVKDRLRLFWDAHPEGRIATDVFALSDDWTRVIVKASIYRHWDNEQPAATGFAEETQTTSGGGANRYSHIENAETSAIGRALANFKYPGSGPRPSREEMQKVQRMERGGEAQAVTYKEAGEHLERQGFRYQPRKDGAAELAARQAPATSEPTDDWTAFWSWARARGIIGRDMLDAAAGCTTQDKLPTEIRALIEAHDAAPATT